MIVFVYREPYLTIQLVSAITVLLRYVFRGIISLAVNTDETSAVNVERVTIPTTIQTAAYIRARKDLGDLSPYLMQE